MSFASPKFTNAGKALELRALAGEELVFSSIKIGDGQLGSRIPSQLTDLVHIIATGNINTIKRHEGYVTIQALFNNTQITTDFMWREIGLYAQDPDDSTREILYAYQNAYDTPEPITPSTLVEKKVNIIAIVDDADSVSAVIDESLVYATVESVTNAIEAHDSSEAAHPDIRAKFSNYVPMAGGLVSGEVWEKATKDSLIRFTGGTGQGNSGSIALYGGNHATRAGEFDLSSSTGSTVYHLVGKPDGKLTWNGNDVITAIGGTMTGNALLKKSTDDSSLELLGGTDWSTNPGFGLYGQNHESYGGSFLLNARKGNQRCALFGKPDGTLTWGGNPVGNPIGAVIPYGGIGLPVGYLPCDGSTVNRTTYAALFNVIGTTYGAGDGSTTFNLPNLMGKVVQGSGIDSVGTIKDAGLPNITGTFDTGAEYYVGNQVANGAFRASSVNVRRNTDGADANERRITMNASYSNAIYGNSDTVQPPAVVLRYVIKY